jgi:hypothetical protein
VNYVILTLLMDILLYPRLLPVLPTVDAPYPPPLIRDTRTHAHARTHTRTYTVLPTVDLN